ncbi:hypothetical protein TL16_g08513 [Triparma laevis f. inornata]|uniref:Uncharacterized protein n=2 Tax=Triparma laevis TaxID=1534972 RepID=A0A9W7C560_9STRA|nr:hypothetical protein TL16_g08513 [Triparma laevis f. inornata]GMI02418.1 hypothetical protein TrLO_g14153 [Triparma laevis f. longispina]
MKQFYILLLVFLLLTIPVKPLVAPLGPGKGNDKIKKARRTPTPSTKPKTKKPLKPPKPPKQPKQPKPPQSTSRIQSVIKNLSPKKAKKTQELEARIAEGSDSSLVDIGEGNSDGFSTLDYHLNQQTVQHRQPSSRPFSNSISRLLRQNSVVEREVGGRERVDVYCLLSKPSITPTTISNENRHRVLSLFRKCQKSFPNLLCFTALNTSGTLDVSGYMFFIWLCSRKDISIPPSCKLVICSGPSLGSSVRQIVKHVNEYVEKEGGEEEVVLFDFVSTSYHLCNLNDIHTRSPGESVLNFLYEQVQVPKPTLPDLQSSLDPFEDPPPSNPNVHITFSPSLYPYRTPPLSFLSKCYLMCQELVPILVNVKGVVERKEFFQRDNFLTLSNIRRGLGEAYEEIGRSRRVLGEEEKVRRYLISI